VTISAGIACVPDPEVHSASDLIAIADQIMYEAKRLGRNRVRTPRGAVAKGPASVSGLPRGSAPGSRRA
jgi:hypothetical protein